MVDTANELSIERKASIPGESTQHEAGCVTKVRQDFQAAFDNGFVITAGSPLSWYDRTSPCVVIEQGKVQLWGHFYRDPHSNAYLPEEGYEALAIADTYPDQLQERDRKKPPVL